MAKFCSQCGTKNEEINNFCFLCGNSLATAATTNNIIKNKATAATEAHAPMMKPREPEHPTADISDVSPLPSEAIKNEANIAKNSIDEPKPIEDMLARGIPHAKPNVFSAGSSSNKKSSSAIKNQYVYITSALVAATVMGGGIYWSQKPKVKEPIITMADITQPRVTKNRACKKICVNDILPMTFKG
ncbi:MAG: zinc ribbon domain-containing protein, partial [Methylotenera sp.]|uniref:zinc ribbon domain-containing protein n=1 Tax=Methylotenera sp. TaxID=2051956 RepID=UPI002488AE0E